MERYSVLDHNGDELESFASWGLATTYLMSWSYSGLFPGSIRDNEDGSIQLTVEAEES